MWNKIKDVEPEEGQQVLGISFDNEIVLGFWNSSENCLTQYSDEGDGYKWAFTQWMPIPALPTAK
jgi:hypothetical protein